VGPLKVNGITQQQSDLERWLAEQGEARGAQLLAQHRLSGGAIQENWALDVRFEGGPYAGVQQLVLRCDAPSAVAASLSRAEEFALFRAAFAAGVRVPEPLWLGADSASLGKCFFVMRRSPGTAAGHRLVKDDSLVPNRPELARQLGEQLARIHSLVPPRADLAFLGEPAQQPALAQLESVRCWLDDNQVRRPVLEWALSWLHQHAPQTPRQVLCHNDFRTGNYLVEAGQVAAVLDWEFAAWGDPLADIGWFCAPCWRFGRRDAEAGGIGPREAFLQGYEQQSGRAVERRALHYWEVMATLRWSLIALQQSARHLRGEERSLELALTGHLLPELELDLLDMTGEGATCV
jgi:aminoglycoside phosphotransferase (APT) family kinase protein